MRAHSRRPRLWIAAGVPAGISLSSSLKLLGVSVLGRGSSLAISIIRIGTLWGAKVWGRPMPGRKSCAGRGLDYLRSDEPQCWQFQPNPVAVARDIRQAMPVTGSFVGMPDDFQEMSVEVLVTS